ncbi:DUF421 domain-containing protein [Streptomyces sp. NPDC056909]|uniref:DUF421 domain-containing protein n=1 Tax=unclassified Streptomyces TaxID=2593676 RepID=UPI0036BDC18D
MSAWPERHGALWCGAFLSEQWPPRALCAQPIEVSREASEMWNDIFELHITVAEKVTRTLLVYVLILILFRFAGKRDLANLNAFDFVVIFLLSNVVQNAIIGDDQSVTGGVIGAATLVAANAAINRWLAVDERAAHIIEGTPTTVIEEGKPVQKAIKRLGLRSDELGDAVRKQTGSEISGVAHSRLEPDGRLVVVLRREERNATRSDIDELQRRLITIEELLRARTEQAD